MNRKMIQNLIAARNPEDAALLSVDNYHARGLSYVNLVRTLQFTAKLYFFDHVRHNAEGYVVSPHDHAYAFETYVVAGSMRNIVFDRAAPAGRPYYTYQYAPASRGGTGGFAPSGVTRLAPRPYHALYPGDGYYLDTDQIHTIAVEQPTILFLIQYADTKAETTLYSRSAKPPRLDGLYTRMSPEKVRALLDMAMEAA